MLKLRKDTDSFFGMSETKLIVILGLAAFVLFEWFVNLFTSAQKWWAQIIALIILMAVFYLLASLFIWLMNKYKGLTALFKVLFGFIVIIQILIIITVAAVRLA